MAAPSGERRLAEALASALDRTSFDIPLFTHLAIENSHDEQMRRVIVYLITYGAIEHANGNESSFAYTCRRLNDTLTTYGEAVIDTG